MTSATLYANKDVYIYASAPTTNYDANDDLLRIGESNSASSAGNRTLVSFDISSIPVGSVINSGSLGLYLNGYYSSNARTLSVYRLKRNWVENQATWNKYDSSNNWETAGAAGANDYDSTAIGSVSISAAESVNAYKDIELSSVEFNKIVNQQSGYDWYGFLCRVNTETDDMYQYAERTHADNKPPRLVVDYTYAGRNFQVVHFT